MGTEALWVPLVVGAVSAAAGAYQQHQVAKKQDNILAQQIRANSAKQQQADEQTKQMIQAISGSSAADEKSAAQAHYQQAIQSNLANAERTLAPQGAVSDAYKKAGSDAALGMATKATDLGNLTAAIDAPTQQRENDRKIFDDYNIGIGQIKRAAAGGDFLAQLKLRSVRPNPWLTAATQIGSGYAKNYSSGMGAAGTDPYAGWMSNDPTYAGPY